MRSLSRASAPTRPALLLLLLAAIPFALAGLVHARLVHEGFWETGPVGRLFLLNGIGTGATLVLLALGRVRLFALGALLISLGSIAGILLSHSAIGFLRLREGEWTDDASLTLGLEVAAVVLLAAAVAAGALRARREAEARRLGGVRLALTGALAALFALAAVGVGAEAPPERPALTRAQLAASEQRLAQGGERVAAGEAAFAAEGCSSCHTMEASDYRGRLGPRLDVEMAGKPAEAVEGATLRRREASLMRLDYADRVDAAEMDAIAAYVLAVAGPTPLEAGD